jgi:hypothetical protein
MVGSKLPTMIPFRVQNPKHDDAVAFDAIENLAREPARDQPAKTNVIDRAARGLFLQQPHGVIDFTDQFIARTGR